ncbi:MAG: hypothetical protein RLZZ165_1875, partial [Bacteroidota bacterium]
TWGNYGYATTPFPGMNGDGLNGMWTNPGGFDADGRCGISSTDLPLAASIASYASSYPAADMNIIIQSRLEVPSGATRSFVTETIAEPGTNCCQAPDCGTLSGEVNISGALCAQGAAVSGQLVMAKESSSQLQYYGITNVTGNYMINAPFGNYTVELKPLPNTNCTASLPNNVLNASTPSLLGLDLLAPDSCAIDMYIVGQYPSDTLPPFCGIPPITPCPGDTFRYCYTVQNTGTSAIPAHTRFPYSVPAGFSILNKFSLPPGCWWPLNNNFAFLNNDLPPGGVCQFCVDVLVPLGAVPPWITTILTSNNANCVNGDPLSDIQIKTDTASCSCDPNIKTAYPIGCGTGHKIELEPITYTIRFNNIGTMPAGRVVVIDRLDSDWDLESFRILESTPELTDVRLHPVPGFPGEFEVHFIWDNINLTPIVINPSAEGNVTFRISPKAGLADGTRLENMADIYFDQNPPVTTNTVFHTFYRQPVPVAAFDSSPIVTYGYAPLSCTRLSPTVTGGSEPYTYVWNTGETTSSISVCPSLSSAYSVTVYDSEGCSDETSVTVNVMEVRCGNRLDKVIVCHNGHEICIGPDAVSAHLAHGCTIGSCKQTQIASLLKQNEVILVPNPASQTATLRLNLVDDSEVRIQLFAIDGRLVLNLEGILARGGTTDETPIDLHNLPAGSYFCRVEAKGIPISILKLLVMR